MSHTAVGELTDMERQIEREMSDDGHSLLVGTPESSISAATTKKNLNGDVTSLLLNARKKAAVKQKKIRKKKK